MSYDPTVNIQKLQELCSSSPACVGHLQMAILARMAYNYDDLKREGTLDQHQQLFNILWDWRRGVGV